MEDQCVVAIDVLINELESMFPSHKPMNSLGMGVVLVGSKLGNHIAHSLSRVEGLLLNPKKVAWFVECL